MRFRSALLVALTLLGCASLPGDRPDYDAAQLERLVLDALNRTRRAHDLAPFRLDDRLSEAARLHSRDLARTGTTGHRGSDGSVPIERVRRQRARGLRFAENVYRGPLYAYVSRTTGPDGRYDVYRWEPPERLARLAVDGWMGSPGHRANVLDADLDRAGLGVALDAQHRWTVTLDLAGD